MSAVGALVLALMSEFFVALSRPALTVGIGDHIVLAPLGIHWADPDAFAGDWFMTNAPQPHWLFDYVVMFGREIGLLPWVLFCYWLLTCFVAGMGTAVLARPWAREYAWGAVIAWPLMASIIPFNVAGSSWLGYPSAVPNMLGGGLLYLLSACVLTGRYRWTLILLPLLVTVHVQIGAIALVVSALGAIACIPLLRRSHVSPARVGRYAAVWVASAVLVVVALKARSVAADPKDFVEICNAYIPFHCAAAKWPPTWVLVALSCATLTIASVTYVRPARRVVFLGTIGVCAIGTLVAMLIDRAQVPVLGEMMQAYNGYRVGLAMYPYAAWGLLLPVLRPAVTLYRRVAALVVVVAMPFLFVAGGSKVEFGHRTLQFGKREALIFGVYLLLMLFAASGMHQRHALRLRRGRLAVVGLCAWVFLAGFTTKMFPAIPNSPVVWGSADATEWGRQARAVLPVGIQVLSPPGLTVYRLPLERGIVVDCKNIPYGGPAYAQWKERLDALGGWDRCGGDGYFNAMPADRLVAVADRYGADAILTLPDEHREQVRDLIALGWTYHHVRAGELNSAILLRPGVQPGGRMARP